MQITQVDDYTTVTVQVPAGQQVMIDILRKKIDIIYKWKGVFRLLGKYQLKWSNGDETMQDVTTVLSGPDRDMYAFGTWKYPNTDTLQVLVTSQGGQVCEHNVGDNKTCDV